MNTIAAICKIHLRFPRQKRNKAASAKSQKMPCFTVGREGVEPSRSFDQRILSPRRLPFRHRPILKCLENKPKLCPPSPLPAPFPIPLL